MLVFVSDMHLTDQTLAPSVCPDALEQLTKEVRQIAKKAKKVKLIFLGDIFDVLRSSRWLVKISGDSFLYTPVSIRPWHAVDAPLERVVSTILADIKKSYLDFFEELSGIENVESIWVSGNHDRLVNETQVGRQFLKDIGVHPVGHEILERNFGVFARHGHFHDKYNIRDKNYKLSPFGDAIVIEILNKLQVEVAKKRKIVNFNHPEIAFLGAMEYVRPHTSVPIWLFKITELLPDVLLRNRTRDAWRDVVDSFTANQMLALLPQMERNILVNLLKTSKDFRTSILKLIRIFENLFENPKRYRKIAAQEPPVQHPNIKYVVYGHTHVPDKYQLNGSCYLNTGWWRRSYRGSGLEIKPYMNHFHILIIHKNPGNPELKRIEVNSPIRWEPPYMISISPDEFFRKAQKAERFERKEALLEKGLIDLFTDDPRMKVKILTNPLNKGFDMVVRNQIRPGTLGKNIAVEIKHDIEIPDIDKLASSVVKAGHDRGWVFTLEKVRDDVKIKAEESNIKIFDGTDIRGFKKGESFKSLLDKKSGRILRS